MIKKMMSIFLSVVMLLGTGITLQVSAQKGTVAIKDGGFESKGYDFWVQNKSNQMYTSIGKAWGADKVRTGEGSLLINGANYYHDYIEQAVNVDKNTAYKLTYWYKGVENTLTTEKHKIRVYGEDAPIYSQADDASMEEWSNATNALAAMTVGDASEWTKQEVEFNSGDNSVVIIRFLPGYTNNAKGGATAVDDVEIIPASYIKNEVLDGGFESKGYDFWVQNKSNQMYTSIGKAWGADKVRTGEGSLLINGANYYHDYIEQAVNVDKNTAYKLTYWYKGVENTLTTEKHKIRVYGEDAPVYSQADDASMEEWSNATNALAAMTVGDASEWTKQEVEFNSGDNSVVIIRFLPGYTNNAKGGATAVDDVEIIPASYIKNEVLDGGFESKGYDFWVQNKSNQMYTSIGKAWGADKVRTGEGSLLINGANYYHDYIEQTVNVDKNTLYILRYWYKGAENTLTTEKHKLRIYGENAPVYSTVSDAAAKEWEKAKNALADINVGDASEWKKQELVFDSGNNSVVAVRFLPGYMDNATGGATVVDDVELFAASNTKIDVANGGKKDYLKLEFDVEYDGDTLTEILFKGDGATTRIFSISNDVLFLMGSRCFNETIEGTYHIEAKYDCEKQQAHIRVTTPDENVIHRSDPSYLGLTTGISSISIVTSEPVENIDEVVKNIKINEFGESDLPTEMSVNDIKIYDAENIVSDFNCVPVSAGRIEINLHSPLIDKKLIDESVSIKGVAIESTEYEKGIYTVNISENLTPNTSYLITVDGDLTGEKKNFKFITEPGVYAEIKGILKNGINVKEIKELSDGDTITVEIDYTDLNNENQSYSIIAAGYSADGRLVNVKIPIETNGCEFTYEKLAGINEIKFFVWNSVENMKALSDDYILPLNIFDDDEVYNIVTTFYGDAGTTRGFAWTSVPEHTDMVIQYAKNNTTWTGNNVEEAAVYAEYNNRLYYKVDIDGLEPGETYVYRIGDVMDNIWSEFYTFTTEPENLSDFSFIGFSDPQSAEWTDGYEYLKYTLDEAMENSPDAAFMVSLGDLTEDGREENHWYNYFKVTRGYAESIPHMAVLGNHEARGDEATSGKNFSLHFNNPKNGADALGDLTADDVAAEYSKGIVNNIAETVYSFDYGNAHFAVLNTGSDWSSSDCYIMLEKQREWLKKDMESSSDKKWKIVMLHQGLYPAKTERWDTRSVLGEVVDECGVDIVLSGHDHIVTRTYPIKKGEVVKGVSFDVIEKGLGTVYAILGSAGPKRYATVKETPEYAAVLNATSSVLPSYTIFNVSDEKIEVVTKQINGEVVDKFVIFAGN